MSSWIGDWERNLLTNKKAGGKYRTQCKLGGEAIMEGDPALWVTDSRLAPLGLSCQAHLKAKAEELGLGVPAVAPVAKVPAPRMGRPKGKLVHGTAAAYTNHKCRCVPCTEANSARSASYRAARRQRAQVPA